MSDPEFSDEDINEWFGDYNFAGISEPKEDEPCPECHGTRKTVINKHVGVEDCPVCAQTAYMTRRCSKTEDWVGE